MLLDGEVSGCVTVGPDSQFESFDVSKGARAQCVTD